MKTKLLSAALATVMSTGAFASVISFTLTDASQSSLNGGDLLYSGTLTADATNTSAVFLNGLTFTFGGPYAISADPFFNNTPTSLSPGQSFSGGLFDVTVPAGTASVFYSGSVFVLGGIDGNDMTSLASANFSTTAAVASVPEPSTWMLLVAGMVAVGATTQRRRRSDQPPRLD